MAVEIPFAAGGGGGGATVTTELDDVDDTPATTPGQGLVWDGSEFVPLSVAEAIHTHAQSDITGLTAALAAKMDDGEAAGGVLDGTYPNPGLAAGVAGNGLSESGNVLAINDGAGLEIFGDTLRVAATLAGAGLTGGSGTALDVQAGTGLEISSDHVRIAAAAAGNGLTGGGASALAVNPGTGLEISSDAVRIAAAAAGDGLTGGGGSALAVDPGDGLQIVSDEVAVASDVARKNVDNAFSAGQTINHANGLEINNGGGVSAQGGITADDDGGDAKVFIGNSFLLFGAGFGDASIARSAAGLLAVGADLDMQGTRKVKSLAAATANGEAVRFEQLVPASIFTAIVAQAADVTHAAASFVNTDLVFTFLANSRYVVDLYLLCTSAAATTGYRFAFDTSVAVDIVAMNFFHALAATGTVSGGDSIADDTARALSSGVQSTTLNPIMGMAIIDTGANGGTARLRFGPEVAASATFKAGSTMRVMKSA